MSNTQEQPAQAGQVERRVRRFDEFFNPYSVEHMKAYENLCTKGYWPVGFVPDSMEISILFVAEIQAKMASAWLKAIKDGVIPGVSGFDA